MYNALTTHNSYPFLDIRSNAGSIYRSITQPCAQVRPLDNDKEMTETDALSLIILELNYSRPFDPETDSVQVSEAILGIFCFTSRNPADFSWGQSKPPFIIN